MARLVPTPKNPIVLNDDGSISVLVFKGRTLQISALHTGLLNPTGYKARFAMTDKYGNTPVATADSDLGSITFTAATLPAVGTWVKVVIPDEDMTLTGLKGGQLDCLLEQPDGQEVPFYVGDWIIWKNVAE
jgi:hypothetical protein